MDIPNTQPTPKPSPKPAADPTDINYTVMPSVAYEQAEPQSHESQESLSDNSAQMPDYSKRRLWYYVAGLGAVLVLAIAAYFVFFANGSGSQSNEPQTKLPKIWLSQYFGSEVCQDSTVCGDEADPDSDGLTNFNEFKEGTNPNSADSDTDGLADGDEVNIYKTDPGLKYTDRREVAVTNDYNDAVSVANEFDPLTPGIKMTAARKAQIQQEITAHGLHEPTQSSLAKYKAGNDGPKNISVFYENGQFSPATVSINRNDTVIWLNKDLTTIMIASDPHPTHTDLPALSSPELAENQTYSFTFSAPGIYGYHNHLNPQIKGTVEVK